MTFEQYQIPLHNLLTHFCTRSIESENRLSEYLTKTVAEQLAVSYNVLDELEAENKKFSTTIRIPNFFAEEYQKNHDKKYFAPLLDIYRIVCEELAPFVDGFYLHGSLATMDYVKGWSDVDTFAVLSKKTAINPKSLLQVRDIFSRIHQAMKRIDPLQHHGVIVATAIDLTSYPEQFLPLTVFKKMKCMVGRRTIQGSVRPIVSGFEPLKRLLNFIIVAEKKNIFEHHAYGGAYLKAEYRNANNAMYQLKYYLGQFLLMPSLFLTGAGKPSYKKDSFDKVRGIFPKVVVDWIDIVSTLRSQWEKKEGMGYVPNAIPQWVQKRIPKDYLKRGAIVAIALLDHIEQIYEPRR